MKSLISLLSILLLAVFSLNAQKAEHIDATAFYSLTQKNDGVILDVRTPQEYKRGHIENSTLISINDPKFIEKVSLLNKEKPLYIYCYSGSRSYSVANYLSKNGFSKVYNLSRGTIDWQRSGYKMVTSTTAVKTSPSYSNEDFAALIKQNQIMLVDFYAQWCAPCKQMMPIVEQIEKDFASNLTLKKVDAESNSALLETYNVASVPELILFKGGQEVWRHSGPISQQDLKNAVSQHLN